MRTYVRKESTSITKQRRYCMKKYLGKHLTSHQEAPLVWPNFVPIRVSYSKCADDAKILYNKLWNIYARRSSCSRGLLTKTTKAVTHFSKGAEKYQEVEYIKAIPNT